MQEDPERAAELAGWLAEQLGALAGHFSSAPETDAASEPQTAGELRAYAASSLTQSEQWLRAVAQHGPQPEDGSAPDVAGLAAHLNDVRGALHGAAEAQMAAAAAADEESAAAKPEQQMGSLVQTRSAAGAELNALRESLRAEADAEHDGSEALGDAVTAHIQRVLESLQVDPPRRVSLRIVHTAFEERMTSADNGSQRLARLPCTYDALQCGCRRLKRCRRRQRSCKRTWTSSCATCRRRSLRSWRLSAARAPRTAAAKAATTTWRLASL